MSGTGPGQPPAAAGGPAGPQAGQGSGAPAPGLSLSLGSAALVARASGALWWPEARLLAVADLHLGRSGRSARRGGPLLPPYEGVETLARLGAEVAALDPATVLCLGDSFDDDDAAAGLTGEERAALARLALGRDWLWLAGNHDPAPPAALPGRALAETRIGPLIFRHIAAPDAAPGEVSGHFHPCAAVSRAGRRIRRPCFLLGAGRLILPAFGAYTGGLDARDPVFGPLVGPQAQAILTGARPVRLPRAALG